MDESKVIYVTFEKKNCSYSLKPKYYFCLKIFRTKLLTSEFHIFCFVTLELKVNICKSIFFNKTEFISFHRVEHESRIFLLIQCLYKTGFSYF